MFPPLIDTPFHGSCFSHKTGPFTIYTKESYNLVFLVPQSQLAGKSKNMQILLCGGRKNTHNKVYWREKIQSGMDSICFKANQEGIHYNVPHNKVSYFQKMSSLEALWRGILILEQSDDKTQKYYTVSLLSKYFNHLISTQIRH